MWFYPVYLEILIQGGGGGLRPIAPCPPPLLRRRAIIYILRSRFPWPDCRSFRFSHAPILTTSSTVELLVGCSGGQFARHWSGS